MINIHAAAALYNLIYLLERWPVVLFSLRLHNWLLDRWDQLLCNILQILCFLNMSKFTPPRVTRRRWLTFLLIVTSRQHNPFILKVTTQWKLLKCAVDEYERRKTTKNKRNNSDKWNLFFSVSFFFFFFMYIFAKIRQSPACYVFCNLKVTWIYIYIFYICFCYFKYFFARKHKKRSLHLQ